MVQQATFADCYAASHVVNPIKPNARLDLNIPASDGARLAAF
jgi:hypothetical protein